jgi:hypothetical protein
MTPSRPFRNRLNDLDPKEWIKFQKSWFVKHPCKVFSPSAKFPRRWRRVRQFFTDAPRSCRPMMGTGSTLVASPHRTPRIGIGSIRLRRDRRRVVAETDGPRGRAALSRSSRPTLPTWKICLFPPLTTCSPHRPTGTCCALEGRRPSATAAPSRSSTSSTPTTPPTSAT